MSGSFYKLIKSWTVNSKTQHWVGGMSELFVLPPPKIARLARNPWNPDGRSSPSRFHNSTDVFLGDGTADKGFALQAVSSWLTPNHWIGWREIQNFPRMLQVYWVSCLQTTDRFQMLYASTVQDHLHQICWITALWNPMSDLKQSTTIRVSPSPTLELRTKGFFVGILIAEIQSLNWWLVDSDDLTWVKTLRVDTTRQMEPMYPLCPAYSRGVELRNWGSSRCGQLRTVQPSVGLSPHKLVWDIVKGSLVMVIDPQLPWAFWLTRLVNKTN